MTFFKSEDSKMLNLFKYQGLVAGSALVVMALGFGQQSTANIDSNQIKFGYVDLQRAIQESSAGKTAKKDLESDYNKKKKELDKMEADLKKMGEDLEKKALVLSDDVKAKKQGEFQQEMMKYRESFSKAQMEVQKKERELTLPIIKDLRDIIGDIAKKENFSMVFEKAEQSVLWAKDELDLTERIVKEFESKAAQEKKSKKGKNG